MEVRFFSKRSRSGGDEFVSDVALPARPRRGPILTLALGGGILIAAIAIATALAVSASRDRAISSAKRELENNAHLVARHYEQVLGDFAAVQKAVAAEIELERISSPDAFERMMGTPAIHRMLASKVTGARELVGVNLWTADGQLLERVAGVAGRQALRRAAKILQHASSPARPTSRWWSSSSRASSSTAVRWCSRRRSPRRTANSSA